MRMRAVTNQSTARFREERQQDWDAFEGMLDRIERGSPRALDDDALMRLPILYRATLSALSVARATSLDHGLIAYLHALSLRGYLLLYGVRTPLHRRIVAFFLADWPAAVRALWRETLVALVVLIAGAIAGWRLVALDPAWFDALLGPMAEGRGPAASAATMRQMLYDGGNQQFLSAFAAFLFTHNAQIAIAAFALGFMFGIPTLLLILVNGTMLGALLEVYFAKGLGTNLIGWLAVHGTTELSAIILSGAAGLHIGTRVALPGEQTRLASAAAAGRLAATAMVGAVIMLMVAGLLEGVVRQTVINDSARYAIGLTMLGIWIVYFYLGGLVGRGRG